MSQDVTDIRALQGEKRLFRLGVADFKICYLLFVIKSILLFGVALNIVLNIYPFHTYHS